MSAGNTRSAATLRRPEPRFTVLDKVLGQGAYGSVHRGTTRGLSGAPQEVAVKVIPETRMRLEALAREAAVMERLSQSNSEASSNSAHGPTPTGALEGETDDELSSTCGSSVNGDVASANGDVDALLQPMPSERATPRATGARRAAELAPRPSVALRPACAASLERNDSACTSTSISSVGSSVKRSVVRLQTLVRPADAPEEPPAVAPPTAALPPHRPYRPPPPSRPLRTPLGAAMVSIV